MDNTCNVIVLGAGITGLTVASYLRKQRMDFCVLEAAGEVGGTWRDHQYPGCGADTEASSYGPTIEPLYSRYQFPTRDELFDYCRLIARKHVGYSRIRLNHRVGGVNFCNRRNRWFVDTDKGTFVANYIVFATYSTGPIDKLKKPVFRDQEKFRGIIRHSSELNSDTGFFKDKKVSIIGCGASTVQIAPTIAGHVERLNIFRRTMPYVKLCKLKRNPRNKIIYTAHRVLMEARNDLVTFFDIHPKLEFLYRWPYRFDQFVLKGRTLPRAAKPPFQQPVQCTRRGFDYLGFRETLNQKHVELVDISATGVDGYYENGLIVNGRQYESDIVILSTGYYMGEINFSIKVDGEELDLSRLPGKKVMYGLVDGVPNSHIPTFGGPLFTVPPRVAEFNIKYFIKLIRHMERNGLEKVNINEAYAGRIMDRFHKISANHIVLDENCPSQRYLLSLESEGDAPPDRTTENLVFSPFPRSVAMLLTMATFSFRHFDFE